MTYIIVIASALLFCAMILNLAAKPKFTRGLTGAFTLIAAVGGLFLYGLGFSYVLEDPLQIIVRTVFTVSRMFAGVNDFSAVGSAPIFQYKAAVTVFWILHLMAFYAMASATISVIGARALKKLRYWLQRYGASVVVYGVNDSSVKLGRELIAGGAKHVVFVAGSPDPALEQAAGDAGALVRSDVSALNPDRKFLKSLGSEKGSPELTLYALENDENLNTVYARKLLSALEESNVSTENVRLVIRGADDSVETVLSASPERYGYGDVKYFSDISVAARMLIQSVPPYSKMQFDKTGRACGDFDAVIVGFGKTGRGVFRQLLCNAQFEGSHFRTAVFSPHSNDENGYFFSKFPGVTENYDINFHAEDARSLAFYNYLRSHSATLRYIVICTGNRDRDAEIWADTTSFLKHIRCNAAVCRCNSKSIAWCSQPEAEVQYKAVYSADILASDKTDRMAMVLNHSYLNDDSISPEKAWTACDYFSRESSRASADFANAFLAAAGRDKDAATAEGWGELSDEMLTNLAKTEHLRWCAFHYSMGFVAMTDDTVRERGEKFRAEIAETGRSYIKICKDLAGRRHACLRPWDELEALSALEQSYTGKYTDYKDMDKRNVLALPDVLRASKE